MGLLEAPVGECYWEACTIKNKKGLKTNGLMSCCEKYIKELFLKRKLHLQMTLRFGNIIKMQGIRPITQGRKLNVNTFLITLMQTKVLLVKPGD